MVIIITSSDRRKNNEINRIIRSRNTYHDCMAQLNHSDSNDVVDTSPTYKALEEGSEAQSKEEIFTFPT